MMKIRRTPSEGGKSEAGRMAMADRKMNPFLKSIGSNHCGGAGP